MNAEEMLNLSLQANEKEFQATLSIITLHAKTGAFTYTGFGYLSDYTLNKFKELGYEAKNWLDEIMGAPEWCGGPITGIVPILSSDRMHLISWKIKTDKP